jgi:hypothetical protein
MKRFANGLTLALSLVCAAAWGQEPAPAPEAAPAQPEEATVRAALESWGCPAASLLAAEDRWYAACGTAGVFVVARGEQSTLVLVERRQAAGVARALYLRNGQLWVESAHIEARPLGEFPLETASAAVPPPQAPLPVQSHLPPPILGPVSESRNFPSRVGGVLELEGSLRPILPIDARAFAGIAELAATYRGQRNWFVQARVFPAGGIVGKGRDAPLFSALAQVGYDHPYFAVGVGAGAMTRGSFEYDYDYQAQVSRTHVSQSTRFTIAQYGRLGAVDGLHLAAQSVFVLLDEWQFGWFELRGQIPVAAGTWLTPAYGGGEEAGFFYADLGLRRLLYGDRRSGSLFARPSVGAAGVDRRDDYSGMRVGPMVGVHVEYRR